MGFDFGKLPRCGAKVKSRNGEPCQMAAMKNGRCYLHGGKSTGPRTREGLARMKTAKTKHGYYTKERIQERRKFNHYLTGVKRKLQSALEEV